MKQSDSTHTQEEKQLPTTRERARRLVAIRNERKLELLRKQLARSKHGASPHEEQPTSLADTKK